MNSTFTLIHNRRSVRKYTGTPISPQEKEAIIQAAMRAPTAGNLMLYSIIEVEDQALKDRLAVTCDAQPFIASAPYVLLFLADYQRWVATFDRAMATPQFAQWRTQAGMYPFALTGDKLTQYVNQAVERYSRQAAELGLMR